MAQNIIVGSHLINAQTISADFTSAVQTIQYQDNIGIQFIWTGTPTGTFSVLVSADYNAGTGVGTFSPLTLSSVPTPAGSGGNGVLLISSLPFCYFKVKYTYTSGTGTLNVWVSGKGI